MKGYKIKDNCLLCNKKFERKEPIIWKMPENVYFCQECIGKFEDETEYKWKEAWLVVEYEPWITLEYNE